MMKLRTLLTALILFTGASSFAQLSGTYTVGGTTPNYATVSAAVSALTTNGVSGPVTFNIRSGTYTGQYTIGFVSGTSASNTVTFRKDPSSGTKPLLSNNAWVLTVGATEYISFENLEFYNSVNVTNQVVIISGNNDHSSFDSCIFRGVPVSTASNNVLLNTSSIGRTTNLSVTNSTFYYSGSAIDLRGSSSLVDSNTTITNNTIIGSRQKGIYAVYQYNVVATNNEIRLDTIGDIQYGIHLQNSTEFEVAGNVIEGSSTSSTNYGMGFNNCGSSTSSNLVYNNSIVRTNTTAFNEYGIAYQTSSYIETYFNSIRVRSTNTSSSMPIYLSGGSNNIFKNNVLVHATSGAVAFYIAIASTGLICESNCLYTPGLYAAYSAGFRNLSQWQALGFGANSVFADPSFTSTTDLHAADISLDQAGVNIAGITTDLEGNSRSATPDLGAYNVACTGGLSGVYTIGGTSPDYATVIEAVDSLNANGVCGAVKFKIRQGTYVGRIALDSLQGTTAGKTLEFVADQANTLPVEIVDSSTSAANNFIVQINNQSYISFDSLTFRANGITYAKVFDLLNNVDHITISNCKLYMTTTTLATFDKVGVYEPTAAGNEAEHITIQNNEIHDGSYAIHLYGTSTSVLADSNRIVGNIIDGFAYYGINTNYQSGLEISGNYVEDAGNQNYPYSLRSYYTDFAKIHDNEIINHGLLGGYGLYIYENDGSSSIPNEIYNNRVVMDSTGGSVNAYGLYFYRGTYTHFYHNTIVSRRGGTTSYNAYIFQPSGSNGIFKNNCYANFDLGYASYYANVAGAEADNNNHYSTGTNIGYLGSAKTTISAFWSGGVDSNSVSVDPEFTSNTDLHASGAGLAGAGEYLLGYTIDIDGDTRANPPCIGADEFSVPSIPAMSGTYTIGGTTPNFTSIGQAIDTLNYRGVSGPVVFNIRQGTYNEQIVIDSVVGASSVNMVTFRSDPANSSLPILSYSASITNNYTIRFDGADYITLRNLDIRSLNSSYSRVVDFLSFTDYIEIDSCEIHSATYSTPNNENNTCIYHAAGDSNLANYCTVRNSRIANGSYGIILQGHSTSVREHGNLIENNDIDSLWAHGIHSYYQDSIVIRDNYFHAHTHNNARDGIRLKGNYLGFKIYGNRMYFVNQNGVSAINIREDNRGTAGKPNRIYNNMIHSTNSGYGIWNQSSSNTLNRTEYLEIHHNTIKIEGTNNPRGIHMQWGDHIDVRNNNIAMFGGVCIWIQFGTNPSNYTSDFNNMYTTGPNFGWVTSGYVTSLSGWRTATSTETSSIEVNPNFVDTTDLHATNLSLIGAGDSSSFVTVDYDGDTRSNPPCIGADEFTGPPPLAGVYTIGGTSPDYTTFALAITDLNSLGVDSVVIFNVRQGTYTEQISLGAVSGASAANTLTFQSDPSNSSKPLIQFAGTSGANHVLELDGTDYITFQNLDFKTTATTYARVLVLGASTDFVTFDSCSFVGKNTTNSSAAETVISYSGGASTHLEALKISNSAIKYGSAGISLSISGDTGSYFHLENCLIDSFYYYGLDVAHMDSIQIIGNTIRDKGSSFAVNYGMILTYARVGSRILRNRVLMSSATRNSLIRVYNAKGTGGDRTVIASNELIQLASSTTGDQYGFDVIFSDYVSFDGNTVKHNSTSTSTTNSCLYVASSSSNIAMYNNNLVNAGSGYALYENSSGLVVESNHNNIYTAGSNFAVTSGVSRSNLAAILANEGSDSSSVSVDPVFVSATQLEPTVSALDGSGTPFLGATNDVLNVPYSNPPDIGAYSFSPPSPLSGVYTIGGTTPDYLDFASAVSDLNNLGISGAVTFNVRQGTYNEQITINDVTGSSSANRITFQSDPSNSTQPLIQFEADSAGNNWTLLLEGTDYVTFKDLHFKSLDFIYGRVFTMDLTVFGITIDSCTIEGGTNSASSQKNLIHSSGWAREFHLKNSSLLKGAVAIVMAGGSSTVSSNSIIENNNIDGFYSKGTWIYNQSNIIIRNNEFLSDDGNTFQYGIHLSNCDSAIQVYNNRIGIRGGSSGEVGLLLETCNASAAQPGLTYNNFIWTKHVTSTADAKGLDLWNSSHQVASFNNIHIAGTATLSHGISYDASGVGSYSGNKAYNNIIANTAGGYGIFVDADAVTNNTLSDQDYNNIYCTGTNLFGIDSVNYTSLAAWSAASGFDSNSVTLNPFFGSDTNLYAYQSLLSGAGVAMPGITTDIDGTTRSNPPNIGAFEYTAPPAMSGIYTIGGTAPDYTNIGTAVSDLDSLGVSGAVTFHIRQGTYHEQITLDSIVGASASNNVTFKADPANSFPVVVEDSLTSGSPYVWAFNGAQYISLRKLEFEATGLSSGNVIRFLNHCEFITIDSCHIDASNVNRGIFSDWSDDLDDVTISNSQVLSGMVNFNGNGTGVASDRIRILGNYISGGSGFECRTCRFGEVMNNEIEGGISFSYSHNFVVKNNRAHDLNMYRSNYHRIENNIFNQPDGKALSFRGTVNDTIRYNTFKANSINPNQRLIWKDNQGATNLIIQNNMFYASGAVKVFAIDSSLTGQIKNNAYFAESDSLGEIGTALVTDLDDLRAQGWDTNSIYVKPYFENDSVLRPTSKSLDNKGVPIAGITTDIDGATRSASTPDIGAYEFVGQVRAEIVYASDTIVCGSDSVILLADSTQDANYKWYRNGVLLSGETTNSLTVTQTGYYQSRLTDSLSTDYSDSLFIGITSPNSNAGTYTSFCVNADSFLLTGAIPAGGYFQGNGIIDSLGIFLPQSAGIGTHTISYIYTDTLGLCSDTSTTSITVDSLPAVSLTPFSNVCENDGIFTLTGGSSAISTGYGYYSGTAVINASQFNPALASLGNNSITFTYVDTVANCSNDTTLNLFMDSLPVVSLSTFGNVCEGEQGVSLTQGSPSGGTYSGIGVDSTGLSFNADSIGTFNITYNYTDSSTSCSSQDIRSISVLAKPNVSIGSISNACANSDTFSITSGYPSGGKYFGTGVVDSSGIVNPVFISDSSSITYQYTNAFGCSNSDVGVLHIDAPPVVSMSAFSDLCVNASSFTLTHGSSSNNGTGNYSGPGVFGGTTFIPALAGVGTYNITYSFTDTATNCTSDTSGSITINALPVISLISQSDFCIGETERALNSPTPTGGSFSGTGILSNGVTFNPDSAGAGAKQITYSYTDGNSCTKTANFTVVVRALPNVSLSAQNDVCEEALLFQIGGASPLGGFYTGDGIHTDSLRFDASAAGAGQANIRYHYENAFGCADSADATIYVNRMSEISFSTIPSACFDASPLTLSFASADSSGTGVYSGNGVSSGNVFKPSVAGSGNILINYLFTDVNGCVSSRDTTVVVHALPVLSFSPLAGICVDGGVDTLQGASPTGGTYFGSNVLASSVFNTPAYGVGVHSIGYTYVDGNGCTDTIYRNKEVYALPTVSLSTPSNVCENAPALSLTSGSPAGGTYSGIGVSNSSFNPSSGAGNYSVFYNYTDSNSCSNSDSSSILVNAKPVVALSNIPSVCADLGSFNLTQGSPVGGTYFTTNTSGALVGSSFNSYVSGDGSFPIFYTYTDGNSCSDTAQKTLIVNPQPTVTLSGFSHLCVDASARSLSGGAPVGGLYFGNAVSGTQYDPSLVGAGLDTLYYTFTDAKSCSDTAQRIIRVDTIPIVSLAPFGPSCVNDSALVLNGGSPSGGVYSGAAGVLSNLFYPQFAGVDTHQIVYRFTDGNMCSATDTQQLVVSPVPQVSFTSQWNTCMGIDTFLLNGYSPLGGYFSGPFVDSSGAFLANSAGVGLYQMRYNYTDTSTMCSTQKLNSILVNAKPSISLNALPDLCLGDGVQLPSGGLPSGPGGVYKGNLVDSSGLFNPRLVGVGVDTVWFIYTDLNSCMDSLQGTLNIFQSPQISFTDFPDVCEGGSPIALNQASPSGGTYSGAGVLNNSFYSNLVGVGQHNIQYAFVDSNGCASDTNSNITVFTLPQLKLTSDTTVCQNTGLVLNASGGLTYSWSNGSKDPSISVLANQTRNYRVTVESSEGCVADGDVQVSVFDTMEVVLNSIEPSCGVLNGSAGLSVFGGKSPFRYKWSTGSSNPTINNLGAGLYFYEVIDQNNCKKTTSFGLSNRVGPSITLDSIRDLSCFGQNNGYIKVSSVGNALRWTNGATTNELKNLAAGIYLLEVEDEQGCLSHASYAVGSPDAITLSSELIAPNCGISNGQISVQSSGGTGSLNYTWSVGGSLDTISGLAAGQYTLTVSDQNACQLVQNFNLSHVGAPEVVLDSIVNANCAQFNGGVFISALDTIAGPTYSYQWAGSTNQDLSGVDAGDKLLTVTDTNNCSRVVTYPVRYKALQGMNLCKVTNDTSMSLNVVHWDTAGVTNFTKYQVLRKSLVGSSWDTVAFINSRVTTSAVDSSLDVGRLTATYAVSYENSCAQLSPIATEHSSMHLSVNIKAAGIFRLSWTAYTGFSFSKYYVHRFSSTSGLELIDSVSTSTLTYLDLNAPEETKNLFYFVSVERSLECGSSDDYVLSNYSVNLAGDEVVGYQDVEKYNLSVHPNPAVDEIWVHLDAPFDGEIHLKLINLRGKEVLRQRFQEIEQDGMKVDVSGLAAGVYHVLLMTDQGTAVRKLVIR